MARRLTDLNAATTPLTRSEILLIQQDGIDKHTSVQNVLDVDYLNGLFDTRLATKTTDDLAEGSLSSRKYFFDHDNTHHLETYITVDEVNFTNLNTNGSVGTGANQVSFGNHHHDAVYVRRDGTLTMSGDLSVPGININTVNPEDTATIFGTKSGANSTMHFRIGNNSGDKLQFETWNGTTATSIIQVNESSVQISTGLTVAGQITGNASTATQLATSRNINGVAFNGTQNITITSNTTNTLTRGDYLTGSDFNGSAETTWAVDAATTNVANKIVARDGSGNFSAGTISAVLSGNATTATTANRIRTGSVSPTQDGEIWVV